MGTKNVSGFKKVFDQDSGLHKLLTYGVAALLLVLCAFLSGSSEEPNPAWGTIILAFLFYYAIISFSEAQWERFFYTLLLMFSTA